MQVIDREELAAAVLNPDEEAFVVYVAPLTLKMSCSPARQAQIALLLIEEIASVPVEVFRLHQRLFTRWSYRGTPASRIMLSI